MLACTACGVLLWDIDAHYAHAHTDRTVGASEGSEDTVRPADDPDVHQVDSSHGGEVCLEVFERAPASAGLSSLTRGSALGCDGSDPPGLG